MKLNADLSGLLLVAIPVIFQIVSFAMLDSVLAEARDELIKLEHEKSVLSDFRMIGFKVTNAFIPKMHLTDENVDTKVNDLLVVVRDLKQKMKAGISFLRQSESANQIDEDLREIQDQLSQIENDLLKFLASKDRSPKLFRRHNRPGFIMLLINLQTVGAKILEEEHSIKLRSPQELTDLSKEFMLTAAAIALVSSFGSVLLILYFNRSFVSGLKKLEVNTARLTSGEELEPFPTALAEIERVNARLIESSKRLRDYREREHAIINNSADVFCSLDEKLRFKTVSEASRDSWGFAASDLVGRSLLALTSNDLISKVRMQFKRLSESEQNQSTVEVVIKCGDGKSRVYSWSVNWEPQQKHFFAVVRDVSEKKELEALKHRFISIVSHDLRAPLASVLASLELIDQKIQNDLKTRANKQLQVMRTNVGRLTMLADEVLDLQKLESGTLALNLTEVRAYNVCAMAAESLDGLARMANIQISRTRADAVFLADEGRLVQCVINLLSNALKFSPAGSTITLDIVAIAEYVEISVKDQGPGLGSEDLEIIFQKFSQSKAVSTLPIKGTGLGLAIVKAIVEAHGGSVGVESTLGKGSRFWMRFSRIFEDDDDLDLDKSKLECIDGGTEV